VFSAGSITSERERQTLDLLLTTTITPWQILWGKLLAGLRVSSVLTMFLGWPLFLAVVLVSYYWSNWLAVLAYVAILAVSCLTTALVALFCSVLFQRTTTSLMTTYIIILMLYFTPLAVILFTRTFLNDPHELPWIEHVSWVGVTSPFAAAFSVPLTADDVYSAEQTVVQSPIFPPTWLLTVAHLWWGLLANGILLSVMISLFHHRWRVAQ
jgi:ABC-type transport system involved in multi-copper enzyme maturation permease subunit